MYAIRAAKCALLTGLTPASAVVCSWPWWRNVGGDPSERRGALRQSRTHSLVNQPVAKSFYSLTKPSKALFTGRHVSHASHQQIYNPKRNPEYRIDSVFIQAVEKWFVMMTFSHLDIFFFFFCKLGKCCEGEAVPVWRIIQPWCHPVSPRCLQLWHRWGCWRCWMKKDTGTFS